MMQGFRSVGGLQRFTSVFSAVRNLFVPPHLRPNVQGRLCRVRLQLRRGDQPHLGPRSTALRAALFIMGSYERTRRFRPPPPLGQSRLPFIVDENCERAELSIAPLHSSWLEGPL